MQLIFKKSSLLWEVKRLWASLVAQLVKNLPAVLEMLVQFLYQENPLEKGQSTHSSILGLSWWLDAKESTYSVGNLGSIPGLGRSLGGGHGNPLQWVLAWRVPMDRGAWQATVHRVTKSWTRLSGSTEDYESKRLYKENL